MLNFVFKEAPKEKLILLESYQTGGSFGLFNSFNRVAGTVGRFSYNTFYQYKRSDGWRPNSGLEQHLAFGSVGYSFAPFLSV
jgi:Fe(3+) dicitrate transport protein